jgi:hypothetical protein
MSSSVMCMLRSAHNPRKLRSGFFVPSSSFRSHKAQDFLLLFRRQIAQFFEDLLFDSHDSLSCNLIIRLLDAIPSH